MFSLCMKYRRVGMDIGHCTSIRMTSTLGILAMSGDTFGDKMVSIQG